MSKRPPKYPWTSTGRTVWYDPNTLAITKTEAFWFQCGPDFERDGKTFRWERERDAEWRVVPRQASSSASPTGIS